MAAASADWFRALKHFAISSAALVLAGLNSYSRASFAQGADFATAALAGFCAGLWAKAVTVARPKAVIVTRDFARSISISRLIHEAFMRLLRAGDFIFFSLLRSLGPAQIASDFLVLGVQAQGVAELFLGGHIVPEAHRGQSQPYHRVHRIRHLVERRAEMLPGRLRVAQPKFGVTQTDQVARVVGLSL